MRSFTRSVLASAILSAAAVQASAQTVPSGQSCGGILCDMGVFGHKAATGPEKAAPIPVPPPIVVPAHAQAEPAQIADEPEMRKVRKKKRVAKAPPVKALTPLAEVSVPAPAPVRAAAVRAPVAPTPAPAAAGAPPAATGPVDLGYLGAGLAPPKPAAPVFRPIYQ